MYSDNFFFFFPKPDFDGKLKKAAKGNQAIWLSSLLSDEDA